MTREIRILHTADTHLGYRQYHSDVRRQDFFEAFEAVVRDAIEMQVDAVVHAGDFFDSRTPTLEDILEAVNIITLLKTAEIPLLAIVGNHESKQNLQWLDLFEEMGLAIRLGKSPYLLENAALYGIDSVPRSKIPTYDYGGFAVPKASGEEGEKCCNLVVMHQLMNPFPYGEWACEEVIENLPFGVDAILLGDYHKYEKIKVGDTWVTYPGSTERNSAAEREPRSYNIITLGEGGLEISRRNIPTRKFVYISTELKKEEKPYEQIFSAVNEYEEELKEAVVFVEIAGDSEAALSFSEIEEYILSKGALVPRIKDIREMEALPPEEIRVSFSDPDRAVAEEIKRMSLTDGGLIIDEIVRNPGVSKTNVDSETESRLRELIDRIDFMDPDSQPGSKIPDNMETAGQNDEVEPEAGAGARVGANDGANVAAGAGAGANDGARAGAGVEKDKVASKSSPESSSESASSDKAAGGEKKEQPEKPETSEVEENNKSQGPEKPEQNENKPETHVPRKYNLGDYL